MSKPDTKESRHDESTESGIKHVWILALLGLISVAIAISVLTPALTGNLMPHMKNHFLFVETLNVFRFGIILAGLAIFIITFFGKQLKDISPTIKWYIGLGGISVFFLFQVKYLYAYTVDDAFITYRFSKHLAEGHGIVWNLGEGPFEGYTNFLWLIILSFIKIMGSDMIGASKIIGVIFGILTMREAALISKAITYDRYVSLTAALLIAFTAGFVQWSCAGLETALYQFLLFYSTRILAKGLAQRNSLIWWSSIPFFLLAITRIEGPVYFTTLWILAFAWSLKSSKENLKPLIRLGVIFTVLYCSYYAWRIHYFGTLFPNVIYAKGGMLLSKSFVNDYINADSELQRQMGQWKFETLKYMKTFIRYYVPFAILPLWAFRKIRSITFLHAALAVICITNFTIVASTKPVMGFWFRHLFPSLIIFYILSTDFIASVLKRISFKNAISSMVALSFMAIMVAVPARHDFETRRFFYLNVVCQSMLKEIGLWSNRNFKPDALLAAIDCGETPYYSELKVLDLWGLADYEIARRGVTEEYFYSMSPDIIVFHSNDHDKLVPHYANYLPIIKSPMFEERYAFERTFDSTPKIATFFAYVKKDTQMRK